MITSSVVDLFPKDEPKPNQFEAIWKRWPNKAKKLLAKAKYEAILAGFKTRSLDRDSGQFVELELKATEEEIEAGVKAYLDSQFDRNTYRYKDDGRYIPALAVFLNQGRYLDHS